MPPQCFSYLKVNLDPTLCSIFLLFVCTNCTIELSTKRIVMTASAGGDKECSTISSASQPNLKWSCMIALLFCRKPQLALLWLQVQHR